MAHIGKSVLIKGELSGSEDLYLDGEVEGSVELKQHSLTIGPHGQVRANIHAREIVVHGKVDGNVIGDDRVELKKSAVLSGDVATQRIVIEDGAFFKGAIDIKKDTTRPEGQDSRRESAMSAAARQVHWLALRRAAIHESISGAPIMARIRFPHESAASAEPLE